MALKRVYVSVDNSPEFENCSKRLKIDDQVYVVHHANECDLGNKVSIFGTHYECIFDAYIVNYAPSFINVGVPVYVHSRESKLSSMYMLGKVLENRKEINGFQALKCYGVVDDRMVAVNYNGLIDQIPKGKIVIKADMAARGLNQVVIPAESVFHFDEKCRLARAKNSDTTLSEFFESTPKGTAFWSNFVTKNINEVSDPLLRDVFEPSNKDMIACEYIPNIESEYRINFCNDLTKEDSIMFALKVRPRKTSNSGYAQANMDLIQYRYVKNDVSIFGCDTDGVVIDGCSLDPLKHFFKGTVYWGMTMREQIKLIKDLIGAVKQPYGSIDIAKVLMTPRQTTLKCVEEYPFVVIETSRQMRMTGYPNRLDRQIVDGGLKAMINIAVDAAKKMEM